MTAISVTHLSCGMPLVVERIAGVKSLGFTWLLPGGSAHDPEDKQGMGAMLSHLLLRGAGERDSRQMADALDALGVSRGTDTQTFRASITATMLGSNVVEALPILVDMVRRPRFDEASIEPVRDLCIQALESLADDPQERVMINLRGRHAPPPLNRSGMGTIEGLESITREDLLAFWRAHAVPGGSVLAVAGDADAAKIADAIEPLLEGWAGSAGDPAPSGIAPRGYHHETDETNQTHIALCHDAPPADSPDNVLEKVVIAALSGGMSGRLFTEVREKRSLCYSVSASYGVEKTYGRVVSYVGTTPERGQEALDVLLNELRRINGVASEGGGIDRSEFERAITGLKSKTVMSGESTSARAMALAQDLRRLGRPRPLEERVEEIDGVTLEDIDEYLARRSLGEMTVATIGPDALTLPEA